MISKFITIRNVGKFVHCSAANDVTFKKLTMIFGENGQGKSTLGDILRSLSTGNRDYIIGRKTLGTDFHPAVQIRLEDGRIVNFKDGLWDAPGPRVAIYDSTFIDDNIHSGHTVEREHRKNLYGVIVGEEGIALAKKVDDYDSQIRDLNRDIKARGEVVAQHVPKGVTLEAFVSLEPIAGVDQALLAKRADVNMLERSQQIKDQATFGSAVLPEIPDGFKPLLEKTIADISTEAEAKTKRHLETHIRPGSEQWLAQGLSLSNGKSCPFCGQGIQALDLIEAFKGYFSASYAELKRELLAMQNTLVDAFGETGLLSMQRVLDRNASLVPFWSQFLEVAIPDLEFKRVHAAVTAVREAALGLIQAKLTLPLDCVSEDLEFVRAVGSLRTVEALTSTYNRAVAAANERVHAKKRETDAGDLARVRNELTALLMAQKRFEEAVDNACTEYLGKVARREALHAEKSAARRRLDDYSKEVFVKYEARINQLLSTVDAAFRIGQTKASLAGGTVSSSFQIVINSVGVELGGPDGTIGKPCFRNTLSAGDRSTLALAFFIARLEGDTRIGETIVLFDDPFTSQDRSRRSHTQRAIHRIAGLCRQVVVLSHDPNFLKQILAIRPEFETKVLQVKTSQSGSSTIDVCDIAVLTQSQYFRDYATLKAFADRREGEPHLVAPAIRRLLETYLRTKSPHSFPANVYLGEMIGKIRIAGPGTALYGAARHRETLDAINEYSQLFHHGEGAQVPADIIDANELHSYVKQTLEIVEAF